MIFSPGEALSEISQWHPISAGDILFLGTPAGVGEINSQDRLEVRCAGLSLKNNVL